MMMAFLIVVIFKQRSHIYSAEIETKILHHYCRLFVRELERSHIIGTKIAHH